MHFRPRCTSGMEREYGPLSFAAPVVATQPRGGELIWIGKIGMPYGGKSDTLRY